MADVSLPTDATTVFSVALQGDVDLARVPQLHELVESYCSSDAVDVLVDLRDVTFMDSTGLGFMARLSREARDRDGTVTLTNLHPEVERVIRMTGMDQILILEEGAPR